VSRLLLIRVFTYRLFNSGNVSSLYASMAMGVSILADAELVAGVFVLHRIKKQGIFQPCEVPYQGEANATAVAPLLYIK
jgi:hypothetical protein